MSEHSPGPWRRNEYDEIEDATGSMVAGPCESREDATLIAAAPEMLALLRTVRDEGIDLEISAKFWDSLAALLKRLGDGHVPGCELDAMLNVERRPQVADGDLGDAAMPPVDPVTIP